MAHATYAKETKQTNPKAPVKSLFLFTVRDDACYSYRQSTFSSRNYSLLWLCPVPTGCLGIHFLFLKCTRRCIPASGLGNEQSGHRPGAPGRGEAAAKGIGGAGERQPGCRDIAIGARWPQAPPPWYERTIFRHSRNKNTSIFLTAWGKTKSFLSADHRGTRAIFEGKAPSKVKYCWNLIINLKFSYKLSKILI